MIPGNIVLIGMPGAGKSTTGVVLAKALNKRFVDTDIVIQDETGRSLQEILDTEGTEGFRKIEERAILSHRFRNTVIATGGSVVLSRAAMDHLVEEGVVVYLRVPFAEIEHRLGNITTRGIVLEKDQTLRMIYDERVPLYERYAMITVDSEGLAFENVVSAIVGKLRTYR